MKLIKMIACASLIALPVFANASSLKIANHTKHNLSFKVNSVCSSLFGVVAAHSKATVSQKDFSTACKSNKKYCFVKAFSKVSCKGDQVAEIGFDKSTGVVYVSGGTRSNSVHVSGEGFNLSFASAK